MRLNTPGRASIRRLVLVVLGWLVLAPILSTALFLNSSHSTLLLGHEAELSPNFSGEVVIFTGPVLPDLRFERGNVGVDIVLGKTQGGEELLDRYALLAASPDGEIAKVEALVREMATQSILRGAVAALGVVLVGWLLLRRLRVHELPRRLLTREGLTKAAVGLVGIALLAVAVEQPWRTSYDEIAHLRWLPISSVVGDEVTMPEQLEGVELRGAGLTKDLLANLIDTYDRGQKFYDEAEDKVDDLTLRQPLEGQGVAVLVSDRHDNVGMDEIAKAIGEKVGATSVIDAGDDTSTGAEWEAFSLDSLDASFSDLDRYVAVGNHDSGTFVGDYLDDHGWTVLNNEVVEGPQGGTITGIPDPRSSGFGSIRKSGPLSFSAVRDRLTEDVCALDEPVNTLVVHDRNLAREVIAQGCADLVVSGHTHVTTGPTPTVSEGGTTYAFTNGTTGGAAFAFALGSKLRRAAAVSLITYDEDGKPAGVQSVTLRTNGDFTVSDYAPFDFSDPQIGDSE